MENFQFFPVMAIMEAQSILFLICLLGRCCASVAS